MKTLFLFALMALTTADNDFYVLDQIDAAALAADIGEFKKLVDCYLNKGPCSELYLTYKKLLPEATMQSCKRCTKEQKQFAYRFFEILKANVPEDFDLFKQIYDPENKYFEALEIELNKYKTV